MAELQPSVDGLMFDEALLGGLIGGLVALIGARLLPGGHAVQRHVSS